MIPKCHIFQEEDFIEEKEIYFVDILVPINKPHKNLFGKEVSLKLPKRKYKITKPKHSPSSFKKGTIIVLSGKTPKGRTMIRKYGAIFTIIEKKQAVHWDNKKGWVYIESENGKYSWWIHLLDDTNFQVKSK